MNEWPDFQIPSEWTLTRMDELATKLKAGGTPSRQNKSYFGGDIPFVMIDDMTSSGVYLKSTKETITGEGLGSCSAWIVPENTVLLSMYATIGATVITTFPVATNQAILAIVPREDYDREYLSFCLQAHKRYLARLNVESTQKNINKGIVSSFQLPIPPLPEQKKIALILSSVQRAIEAQERIIQTTNELKKALMHKLFTEGLSGEPQKQTEIGLVPESWEVCKVGDVAKVQSGGTPSRDVTENWSGGTIPWVKTGEINYCLIQDTEEKITPTGLANSAARLFPKGTLLMAMYGQGITRGKVGLLGIEAASNQACASITPTHEKRISSAFMYYFFEYHYEDLRMLGHGANQKNMNAALIRSFPLTFPKGVEQAAMVTALDTLDKKRGHHEQKKSQLQDLFRTLLHELMTAKTRVNSLLLPC